MMGLEQIKAANRNHRKYAMEGLSSGQERRNNARPSAYWSEKPARKSPPKERAFKRVKK